MQLKNFRDELLDLLLQFLWSQWSSLGVAGYGESEDPRVIDPEALLLFSATIARYDQRLFDEVLDWLVVNERFINVQRLKVLMKKEGFQSAQVIYAIAGDIQSRKSNLKWKKLSDSDIATDSEEQINLFYLKSGNPMPTGRTQDLNFMKYGFLRNPVQHRGMSKVFPEKKIPSLLLQIRGLMGVNSRSEILLYLILNKQATIQEIADQNYYSWRSVQDVLYEMGHSSVIHHPEAKRGRVYYLNPEPWLNMLLCSPTNNIQWICWPSLFRSLEIIWSKLNEPHFKDFSTLEQAAEFNDLMDKELTHRIIKSGYGVELGKTSAVWGEEYLENLLNTIRTILL